jgi:hypothetical protein
MTYTPLSDHDIINKSSISGIEGDFCSRVPEPYTTSTSGGGDVQPNSEGTDIKPGKTSGDSAEVRGDGISSKSTGNLSDQDLRAVLVFSIKSANGQGSSDFVDKFRLGMSTQDSDITNERGAVLDLTGEQFWADGDSAALNSHIARGNLRVLEIYNNRTVGETTFTLADASGVIQQETLNSTPNRYGAVVWSKSGGQGDNVRINYHRNEYHITQHLEP